MASKEKYFLSYILQQSAELQTSESESKTRPLQVTALNVAFFC